MLEAKELNKIQKSFTEAKDRLAFIFEALGDQTRLKIFRLLAQKRDLCVTDVAKVCGISVPAASYQLKILELVGLARKERMGKMICYEIEDTDPIVKKVINIIK